MTDVTRTIRVRRLRATSRAALGMARRDTARAEALEEHADYCEALAQSLEMGAPVEDEHYAACRMVEA